MAQMGHTSPSLALAIYAREIDRRDGEPERLRALVEGRTLATVDERKVVSTTDEEGIFAEVGRLPETSEREAA